MPQKGIINPMLKYPKQISSTRNESHALPRPKRSYSIYHKQINVLDLRVRFKKEFDATTVGKHKQMIAFT